MNRLLSLEEVHELTQLGVADELFDLCMRKVELDYSRFDNTGVIGIKFELFDHPSSVSAWWKDSPKSIEEMKAKIVYDLLTLLTSEDITELKIML